MKKIFTTLFAILLIASLSVTAFADTRIVNVIAGMNDTQPAAAGRESGMELIRQTASGTHYERREDRNELILEFPLREGAEDAPEGIA